MKASHLILIVLLILVMTACKPPDAPTNPPEVEEPAVSEPADVPEEPASPEEEPAPVGNTITVTSTDDSGAGTLRQALEQAQDGDTILFDPAVFPPDAAATIFLANDLPHIRSNYLTIDASNAGVILDGSQSEGWAAMQIVSGKGDKVMGLQFSYIPGPAVAISGGATQTQIGGDRGMGTGPFGQGNQITLNANGIDISGSGTSQISIIGNLIGTDANGSADLGNWGYGISIDGSAQNITIGPDNIIAFNREGIKITNQIGESNTITQNRIFGNEDGEIWLAYPSLGLTPPSIFSYDLDAGTVSGSTCPNCIVEIFSDSAEGGEIYEGYVQADEIGEFDFEKGSAFAGPELNFTATDTTGNTSVFIKPISQPERNLVMQLENDLPRVPVVNQPFDQLADNHIGVWFEAHDRFWDTDFVFANGFKRMRIGGLFGEGQWWGSIINGETLSPAVDSTIREYADAGVETVLSLEVGGAGLQCRAEGNFQTEAHFEQYLAYVNFAVSHFRGVIDAYEILNEPAHENMPPELYVNVIERTIPVIRAADPDAKIIIGAIQGSWENGYPGYGEHQRHKLKVDYLNSVIQGGVVDQVDGVSWHALYDNVPSDPYYQDYPNMVQGIKDLAAENGFSGEYYADEIMWVTIHDPVENQGPPISQMIAAKYYLRTIAEHRALGMIVTVQTFFQVPFLAPIRNINNVLAGAEPIDLAVSTILDQPVNLRQYAFTYPDGSKLVAVWANDIGVEVDPGIESVVTIPGITASKVFGIDPIYGYEQELNFKIVDGDLVIENLMVKDYPILIRIEP